MKRRILLSILSIFLLSACASKVEEPQVSLSQERIDLTNINQNLLLNLLNDAKVKEAYLS